MGLEHSTDPKSRQTNYGNTNGNVEQHMDSIMIIGVTSHNTTHAET